MFFMFEKLLNDKIVQKKRILEISDIYTIRNSILSGRILFIKIMNY